MPPSASELLDRAANTESLQQVLKNGIGATLLAVAASLVSGIITIADLLIQPVDALGDALVTLTSAVFGGPARIIAAGTQSTVASLLGPFNVGPATFALGIGSVLLGLYLVNRYLSRPETGNIIPALPDVPLPGLTDPEEEDE